jgi:hypothetical protein
MPARPSRRSFVGAAGAATLAAALRGAQDGREVAPRDTAHLYERPS